MANAPRAQRAATLRSVAPPVDPSASAEELEALRDRLLMTSWQLLSVLEQLGPAEAKRVLAAQHAAAIEHANERLVPLKRWKGLSERSYATYVGGNNHVRIARLLDFLEDGDRILDVGIGYGYLTSVLMRTGLPEYYCGIDLTERFVEATHEGLRANGLSDEHVHLEVGNLYDLTPAWVRRHRPTLVLLLEVLEHVEDTQLALDVLAGALEPGTSVLFTVPMLNRLEGVWGHRSLFDQRRLRALCEHAGLTIQYVEPLHNVWTLVLATTSPEVPSRLLSLARTPPPPEPPSAAPHGYVFRDVELKGPAETFQRTGGPTRGYVRVVPSQRGLQCRIQPRPRHRPPLAGGVAFPAEAPAVIRLQVQYDDPQGIKAMCVDGYAGDQRVARWKWTLGERPPASGERVVHVLKPGPSGRFVRVGPIHARRIERVEVYAELDEDAREAAFTLMRAAYVPNVA